MEQIILTWDEFKDIWDQCLQKLLLRLCIIPKLDLKAARVEEHSLLDKVEAASNVDLEITDYKNDLDKNVNVKLYLQKKLADI